jgi:hypothetical protein
MSDAIAPRMSSRLPRVLLALSCALLLATVVVRPLWYDEILGHWTATQAWPDGVRAVTRAGVDLQPPTWYLLVRVAELLTGSTHGPRLLSLAGVVAAAFLAGRLARERWGPETGQLVAAALLVSGAHEYAWEGRPYGLLLGCAAVALFAWCRLGEGWHRARWLAVLGLSLLACAQLHYFAVLIWLPLGVGEAVRSRARGRLDLPVLAVGVLPLVALLPLVPDARAAGRLMQTAPFRQAGWRELGAHYRGLLEVLLGAGIACVLLIVCRGGPSRAWTGLRDYLRDPSGAAVAGFLLLPAAAMAASVVGGSGISHERYALAFTLGASLVTGGLVQALLLDTAARQRAAVCAGLAALLVSGKDLRLAWLDAARASRPPHAAAPPDLPVLHPPGTEGLEIWQAADAGTRQRMLLAADPVRAADGGWKATVDVNLSGARSFFPFPVVDWQEVRGLRTEFVLLQPERSRSWVTDAILKERGWMEPVPASPGWEAWRVRLPLNPPPGRKVPSDPAYVVPPKPEEGGTAARPAVPREG